MRFRRWLPTVAWAGVIEVLTSVQVPAAVDAAPAGSDKVVHVAMYGVLGFLAARAAQEAFGVAGVIRTLLIVLAAVAVFGALDEWHQQFIPERSMDLADWFADVAGGAAGVAMAGALGARATRRRSE